MSGDSASGSGASEEASREAAFVDAAFARVHGSRYCADTCRRGTASARLLTEPLKKARDESLSSLIHSFSPYPPPLAVDDRASVAGCCTLGDQLSEAAIR